MHEHRYIACDLGAESGRVMLGTLLNERTGSRLSLTEVHRFPSPVVRIEPGPSMRWDVSQIFDGLQRCLREVALAHPSVDSVSVDSWAVDYALLADGKLLSQPFHYRDARTATSSREVRDQIGDAAIFEASGIQFLPFNTLYQLAAESRSSLGNADTFLTIADYFNYLLSGIPVIDESNASTTQLYDPRTRQWSKSLIELAALPAHVFPKIVSSGTVIGPLLQEINIAAGFAAPPRVVATCSHDTGAAVAAVPASGVEDWAYLSSGTWSLLGVELPEPLINERVRRANFTNEAGFGGTTRFLKNIVGLWILQELRREWANGGSDLAYAELSDLAGKADSFRSFIQPNDIRFVPAGDMAAKIAGYCRETNQPIPATPGHFVRCVLESLALLYRSTLEEVESLTGRHIQTIHIVGGGSQNALLNQCTANATGRKVLAGPVEASAIGNVLVQAIALKHVPSISAARDIVRNSFQIKSFTPADAEAWQRAYERFAELPVSN